MRRKIGVYIEHGVGGGVGGAELLMATLASAWSHSHDVDLIHHRPALTTERLAHFTTTDLSKVRIKVIARECAAPETRNIFRRYRNAVEWHRHVSADYDLFVNCTHWLPCFCHATRGVLLVLFPIYTRPEDSETIQHLPVWKRLRHATYFGAEWSRRLASYQAHVAISQFSRIWTRTRWGTDCDVVYPPVQVNRPAVTKERLILSVGRFVTRGHHKKQLELMTAFRAFEEAQAYGWRYVSVGGINDRPENHAYFAQVKAAAADCPSATIESNADEPSLRAMYSRAAIFWHATGFDDDTDGHPELAEHFGMATAEAMAAGCVPVVVNKGGQAEIVRHGENGFLWNTLDELKHYTRVLIRDEALRKQMACAARLRAQSFSRARFLEAMSRHAGLEERTPVVAASPYATANW